MLFPKVTMSHLQVQIQVYCTNLPVITSLGMESLKCSETRDSNTYAGLFNTNTGLQPIFFCYEQMRYSEHEMAFTLSSIRFPISLTFKFQS